MSNDELIQALRRMKVELGSYACVGCGHEYNCGLHGCAILRKAIERIELLKEYDDAAEQGLPEINQIADYYGLEGQLNQAQEECAELIQAISKYRRVGGIGQPLHGNRVPLTDISEEMADVDLMLEQLRYLLGNGTLVDEIIGQKVDRQLQRMEEESKEGNHGIT